MVGVDHPDGDLDRVRRGDGQLLRRLELGVGRRRDALRAARAGGRPDPAHRRVLPGADHLDGGHVVGVGGGCVGRDEVFQACEYFG